MMIGTDSRLLFWGSGHAWEQEMGNVEKWCFAGTVLSVLKRLILCKKSRTKGTRNGNICLRHSSALALFSHGFPTEAVTIHAYHQQQKTPLYQQHHHQGLVPVPRRPSSVATKEENKPMSPGWRES